MSTEIVEIIESKVTKAEMVDMLIYEEEDKLNKELKRLRDESEAIKVGIPTAKDFRDGLNELAVEYFKKKYPETYALAESMGPVNVEHLNASYLTREFVSINAYLYLSSNKKPNPRDNSLPAPSNNHILNYPLALYVNFNKTYSGNYKIFRVMLDVEEIPGFADYIKPFVEVSNQYEKILAEMREIKRVIDSLSSKSRQVKAHLTKSLLMSTPEGVEMMNKLKAVKAKITKQDLLDI